MRQRTTELVLMKDWYARSRETIEVMFGKDAEMVSALLAATSGRQTMQANVTMALRAYRMHQLGSMPVDGFLPSHLLNVRRALRGEALSGLKVTALFRNLVGDESAVAVDRWVLRYLRGNVKDVMYRGIAEPLFRELEAEVVELARKNDVTPAQMQISIWCFMSGERRSYSEYLCQMRML